MTRLGEFGLPIHGQPDEEYELRDDVFIISSSDLAGRITSCNSDFVEVSGYSANELIGRPHNLIRHPDTPKAVFHDLWATIKQGRVWQGVIKNRRKSGEYYWVSAMISPIIRDTSVVGYTSIRKKASRDQVAKAEQRYQEVRTGSGTPMISDGHASDDPAGTIDNRASLMSGRGGSASHKSFVLWQTQRTASLYRLFILVIVAALNFGLWTTFLLLYKYDKDLTIEAAMERATNNALVGGRLIESIATSVDDALRDLGREYLNSRSQVSLSDVLLGYSTLRDSDAQLSLIDLEGNLLSSSHSQSKQGQDWISREVADIHRNRFARNLHISGSTGEGASGAGEIRFSRPIYDSERLVAVGVLSVKPAFFEEQLALLNVGKYGFSGLFRTSDHSTLAITMSGHAHFHGFQLSSSAISKSLRQGVTSPEDLTISSAEAPDGLSRIVSARLIENFPLLVLVGVGLSEVIEEPVGRAKVMFFSLAAFSLITFSAAIWSSIQVKAYERFQVKIINREKQLELMNSALNDGLNEISKLRDQISEQAASLEVLALNRQKLNEKLESEIAERKRAEETMRHMAQHDALTGLANRRLFYEVAESALALARRNSYSLAILSIDIDGFKSINDTMGHEAGDEMLRSIADRYRSRLRDSDVVARFGGDEFVALLPQISSALDAERAAMDLVTLTAQPFQLRAGEARVGASVGIALFPKNGDSLDDLLASADDAMYRAKKSGKNQYRFGVPREKL